MYGALGSHSSSANHNLIPSILTLIAEYHDEIIPSFTPSISDCLPPLPPQFISSIGFGKKMWNDIGDIGKAPPLPRNICEILERACPFFSGQTVGQSHTLVLIPETLNGKPMTLFLLGQMMGSLDQQRKKTGYNTHSSFGTHAFTPFGSSHWVLMANNVPYETRNKTYDAQKSFLQPHHNYQVPKLAQAVVAVFMNYLATGIRRFGTDPWTYTRTQEADSGGQLGLGAFDSTGLFVTYVANGEQDSVAFLLCGFFSPLKRSFGQALVGDGSIDF